MADSPSDDALFVRLYLDRHIMTRLADDLQERGFGCLTTQQAGMDTASDEEQLAFATAQGRAILLSTFGTSLHSTSNGRLLGARMQASLFRGSLARGGTASC